MESGSGAENSTVEQLRNTDPRDYIRIASLQKEAETIDKNLNNRWSSDLSGPVWTYSSGVEIISAETVGLDGKRELLLLAKKANDEVISGSLKGLDGSTLDLLGNVVKVVANRFPADKRPVFLAKIINSSQKYLNMSPDQIALDSTITAIDLLSDINPGKQTVGTLELPRVTQEDSGPTRWQEMAVRIIMEKVGRKLSPVDFEKYQKIFAYDISRTDSVYGRNYKYVLFNMLDFVVSKRPDTVLQKDHANNKKTDRKLIFPVKDLVKVDIKSPEELKETLSKIPVEKMPNLTSFKREPAKAEFVNLDKVVGGREISNWYVISNSTGRGSENIYKILQSFKDGSMDLYQNGNTIDVVEINGRYFINGDGRHRTAALKALGVPFIPMMVTHCKQQPAN